jgi:hypothetical protein
MFDECWNDDNYKTQLFKTLCNGKTMATALLKDSESFPVLLKEQICPPGYLKYSEPALGQPFYTKPYFFDKESGFSSNDSPSRFKMLMMNELQAPHASIPPMLIDNNFDLNDHLYFICYLKAI